MLVFKFDLQNKRSILLGSTCRQMYIARILTGLMSEQTAISIWSSQDKYDVKVIWAATFSNLFFEFMFISLKSTTTDSRLL